MSTVTDSAVGIRTVLIASGAAVAAGAAAASFVSSSNNSKQKAREAATSLQNIIISHKTAGPESFEGLPSSIKFGSFINKNGIEIHTISLKSTAATRSKGGGSIAVLVHGVGEHCHRPGYGKLYEALSAVGVDVYSMDHQGHGLSGGERGYVGNYTDFIDDVETYVRSIVEQDADESSDESSSRSLFLIGQSMGANLAAQVALRLSDTNVPVSGMLLTSPMIGIDMNPILQIQNMFGTVLDRLVPKAKLVDAVRPIDLSRDEEEVRRYVNDPLIYHGNMKVHLALQLKAGMETLQEGRGGIRCPVLLLHGSDDHTTSLSSALEFFDNISTSQEEKRMVRLVGMKHEVFNEYGKEGIVDMAVSFVTGLQLPEGDKPRSEGSDIDGVIELDLAPSAK